VAVRNRVGVSLIVGASIASVVATPAWAAPACTFDPVTATVQVTVGDGETATLGQSGGVITLNATPCDPAATVTSVDRIVITATGAPTEVAIDLTGGPFAPGLTPETDGGDPEIEFEVSLPSGTPTVRIVGSAGDDAIVIGVAGINLNAAEAARDVDVTIGGSPALVVEGGEGTDVLSAAGGAAEGAATAGVTLRGGPGDDLLLAASGPNTLQGEAGTDTADYSAATQLLVAELGPGRVLHADGSIDALSGIENLTGSPGNDTIAGDEADNTLRGGAGDDTIEGGDGDDMLSGDDGTDTVEFRRASDGVTVDLAAGTATGAGDDQLEGFENVTGSDVADTILGDGGDNFLRGLYGRDEVRGGAGDDHVRGGKGGDVLFGGPGDDLVQAGHGRDQLNGGRGEDVCRGAPGPDSFVFCENFPTRE
jgi:Ca2+-binding RTX toxin-like protein